MGFRHLTIDRDWLEQKYLVERLSTHKIAKLIGCGAKTVALYLHNYGIPVRSIKEAQNVNNTKKLVQCTYCGKNLLRKNYTATKFDKFFCNWNCAKMAQRKDTEKWRNSYKYKKWRYAVYKRDNYTCKLCGCVDDIEAHHIIEGQHSVTLRYEVTNGITLCSNCHSDIHRQGSENFIKPLRLAIGVANLEYRGKS